MHYSIKTSIVAMLSIIVVSLILTQTNKATARWTENELRYALRVATQDAAAVMMKDTYLFGTNTETQDFDVDLEKAKAQFERSFFANIGSNIDSNLVNKMSITLSGYVGYRYVYGIYGSGSKTVPFGYTWYDGDSELLYEFTLGDKIFATNMGTGAESVLNLSALPERYFRSDISNKNFRNIRVMSAVNDFLNVFYGDSANIVASNAGTDIRFELAAMDYAENDPTVMTKISSMIDGPSFFAVVDIMDPRLQTLQRVISLGGAELKYAG